MASTLPQILPLLVWTEQREVLLLQDARTDLQRRILSLRPHSHRRVVLEARLRDLTAQQLKLQTAIGRAI
ncbi:hypothetical protein [Mesorhizobium sp. Root157]|uniref:hypothetical protein n=1 Tax=Mesorhizobium sp. Root157 TaxID=1736477 RepID=UPI000AC2B1D1|nr:hypothetical protein [Mesorhizobium sp. Root157]